MRARDAKVFSPPLKLTILFQGLLGGLTYYLSPASNGSPSLSHSMSAIPPCVSSAYISFMLRLIVSNDLEKILSLLFFKSNSLLSIVICFSLNFTYVFNFLNASIYFSLYLFSLSKSWCLSFISLKNLVALSLQNFSLKFYVSSFSVYFSIYSES